jgi:hypothetical protein
MRPFGLASKAASGAVISLAAAALLPDCTKRDISAEHDRA